MPSKFYTSDMLPLNISNLLARMQATNWNKNYNLNYKIQLKSLTSGLMVLCTTMFIVLLKSSELGLSAYSMNCHYFELLTYL